MYERLHIQRFTKRPLPITAVQVTEDNINDLAAWCSGTPDQHLVPDPTNPGTVMTADRGIYIWTLEGRMRAEVGDWIIKGIHGEFYPCKPEIFEESYDYLDTLNDPHTATLPLGL